jgi:hypothetical protein
MTGGSRTPRLRRNWNWINFNPFPLLLSLYTLPLPPPPTNTPTSSQEVNRSFVSCGVAFGKFALSITENYYCLLKVKGLQKEKT